MSKPDWDDPAVAEQWRLKARARITQYLDERSIPHGRIGEGPAWEVMPYVSIWAIESSMRPEALAWWVVYGDLPTDYMPADKIRHPRPALKAFADRWAEVAALMLRGEKHSTIKYGPDEMQQELGPMLASRAQILAEWSGDDSLWGPEYD